MDPPAEQPELGLEHKPNPRTIPINGRCTLKKEGATHVIYVAGLPMHHWVSGDRMTEAYAMVSLVRCGYADQNDVARAFGRSARTVRRLQRRFESGGMAQLATPGGRARGSQSAPSPWVQTAGILRRAGVSVRDIAHRLGVGKTAVSKWLARSDRPGKPEPSTPSAAPVHPSGERPGAGASPSRRGSADLAPGPSLDPDPQSRLLDRLLARFGLLQDADPSFVPGRRVPRAGVLLAVPALVHSGIVAVAEEVYGHIGPAFYGLRTTVLALLLMALLRIKRPEGLKEHAPPDLGRLLGLDRAPEVKTLRRKLTRLAAAGKAEVFGHKLAHRRVSQRGRALGFLYVDGDVRGDVARQVILRWDSAMPRGPRLDAPGCPPPPSHLQPPLTPQYAIAADARVERSRGTWWRMRASWAPAPSWRSYSRNQGSRNRRAPSASDGRSTWTHWWRALRGTSESRPKLSRGGPALGAWPGCGRSWPTCGWSASGGPPANWAAPGGSRGPT